MKSTLFWMCEVICVNTEFDAHALSEFQNGRLVDGPPRAIGYIHIA